MNCFSRTFFLGLSLLFAFGCAPALTAEEVLNRDFTLRSVDGQAFSQAGGQAPALSFLEDFRVSGKVCNRFSGVGELRDGLFVVRDMAATKMFCMDGELNRLETILFAMLEAGVELTPHDDGGFTLRADGHEFVYTLQER